MDATPLLHAIRRVRFAAVQSASEEKPFLNGILWRAHTNLELTAADGYILARETIPLETPLASPWCGVVALGAMRALMFLLEESTTISLMRISDNTIVVSTDVARLVLPRYQTNKDVGSVFDRVVAGVESHALRDAMAVHEITALPSVATKTTPWGFDGDVIELAGVRIQRDLAAQLMRGLESNAKCAIYADGPGSVIRLEALQAPWRGLIMPLSAARGEEARHAN